VGGKGGGGGRGEKWTKPCMHIWIIKEKWKKKRKLTNIISNIKQNKTKISLVQSHYCRVKQSPEYSKKYKLGNLVVQLLYNKIWIPNNLTG
jgi:hypothetical protein